MRETFTAVANIYARHDLARGIDLTPAPSLLQHSQQFQRLGEIAAAHSACGRRHEAVCLVGAGGCVKRIVTFLSELLRRKVVRLLGAYVVIFWLLIQGFSDLFPILGFPDWALRAFVITGLAVIPILAWFSWKYDFMPPQLVKDVKDVEAINPALSWAMRRHDNYDAGYVLLRWNGDDDSTKEKRFFKPLSIGRGLDNEVAFSDERVSRHHAVIWAEEGTWRIKDTESANGTFMNHAPVTESTTLPQSCELRFHPNGPTLRVVVDKPAATKVT